MADNKTYIISFFIKDDRTYQDRYNSLTDRIESLGLHWDETTSFYAVRSDRTLKSIGNDLYVNTDISSGKDHLLIIDSHTNQAYYKGPEKPDSYYFTFV